MRGLVLFRRIIPGAGNRIGVYGGAAVLGQPARSALVLE